MTESSLKYKYKKFILQLLWEIYNSKFEPAEATLKQYWHLRNELEGRITECE